MEVGVKESSKRKLLRSTIAGHVEQWQMKNWQYDQISINWRGHGCEEE